MTVKELQALLAKYPAEMEVTIDTAGNEYLAGVSHVAFVDQACPFDEPLNEYSTTKQRVLILSIGPDCPFIRP